MEEEPIDPKEEFLMHVMKMQEKREQAKAAKSNIERYAEIA